MRKILLIDVYNDEEWLELTVKSAYRFVDKVYIVDGYNGRHRFVSNYSSDRTKIIYKRLLGEGYDRLDFMRSSVIGDNKVKEMMKIGTGLKMIMSGSQVFKPSVMSLDRIFRRVEEKNLEYVLMPSIKVFGNINTVMTDATYEPTIYNEGGKGKEIVNINKYDLTYMSSMRTIEMKDKDGLVNILRLNEVPEKGKLARYDTGLNIKRSWHYEVDDEYLKGNKLVLPKTNLKKIIIDGNAKDFISKSLYEDITNLKGDKLKDMCGRFNIKTRKSNDTISVLRDRLMNKMIDTDNIIKYVSIRTGISEHEIERRINLGLEVI